MVRLGPRNWIAAIAVFWGLICCALSTVTNTSSFYVLRFLLGIGQSGFFPSVIYYVRTFLPPDRFGFAYGLIFSATCIAMILGGPFWALVDACVESSGAKGMESWRWLFLIEGIPSIIIGCLLPFANPNKPSDVKFGSDELGEEKKKLYLASLQAVKKEDGEEVGDGAAKEATCVTIGRILCTAKFWFLALASLCHGIAFWGVVFWVPRVVAQVINPVGDKIEENQLSANAAAHEHESHMSSSSSVVEGDARTPPPPHNLAVDLLSAIPYSGAIVGNLLNAWHSDRTGERRWHLVAALSTQALGLICTAASLEVPPLALFALTVTAAGAWSFPG